MHHYTHWVFDLDGTLTVPQHDFEALRGELEIPPGQLILEYLEQIEPTRAEYIRARVDEWEASLVDQVELADGVNELLAELSQRGARCGILTRNTRNNALRTLENTGLTQCFDPLHVLGRESATPKPSPEGIAQLLSGWKAATESSVMVGDFRLDLEAGRNAGIATAHVAERDADHWPELTDHRFYSIRDMLNALNEA